VRFLWSANHGFLYHVHHEKDREIASTSTTMAETLSSSSLRRTVPTRMQNSPTCANGSGKPSFILVRLSVDPWRKPQTGA